MAPRTIRWGILATGGIATTFTKDLLCDPTTRGVENINHTVAAAASSSSASRAQDFLKEVKAPSDAKAYGSYEELVKDSNVEIIYVATPHSHHYQNVMLALEHGKHVLCEKAFTVNAAQLKKLVQVAREKNLFLMEAVWTRYFPLSCYVRDTITSGRIGQVHRIHADNSLSLNPEKSFAGEKHRMVNMDLAGGALLDLGIYSLTWVFQCAWTTQEKSKRQKPSVLSATKPYHKTGADEMMTILLTFPRSMEDGGDLHAVASTGMRTASDPTGDQKAGGPSIRIWGDKGEIQVFPPAFRPLYTKLILHDGTVEDKHWSMPGPGKGSGWKNGFGDNLNSEGEGHGMFFEADEAGFALLEGRLEGQYEDLDESIVIMEVMDEARKQGGLKYPDAIESLEYPLKL